MRFRYLIVLLAMSPAAVLAADSAYRLDMGTSVESGTLKVEPRVSGPANKALRYEMKVRREGSGGSSNSNQAGTVRLDDSGEGHLASNSVSISPSDRYTVTVKLLEAGRVVAEKTAQYP
jgi:hypothetical protein